VSAEPPTKNLGRARQAGGQGRNALEEDVGNLRLLEVEAALEDVVGLGDELHVAVLDAVVDHLDVVAGAGLADPVAAGLVAVGALDLGGGLLC